MICFSRARIVPGPHGKWPLGACAPEDLVGVVTGSPPLYHSEEVARIAHDAERTYGVRPWAAPQGVSSRGT